VLIPIIRTADDPAETMVSAQGEQMEMTSQLTAEKTAQYAAQTERLEQRVRVLERIITDKGVAVADQIEQLREKPLN
jgi:hypothetical protein